jgi:hypothetical protein
MFKKIKAKLEEALLEIEIGIEEAIAKGDQALVNDLDGHLTATKASIAKLEAKIASLEGVKPEGQAIAEKPAEGAAPETGQAPA